MRKKRNRSLRSSVVLAMERSEERNEEWSDEGPMTQRCVYVQDRESQRWLARAQTAIITAASSDPPATAT